MLSTVGETKLKRILPSPLGENTVSSLEGGINGTSDFPMYTDPLNLLLTDKLG